jgi:glycosyltransferase involved in cell wall biosynthesis
MPEKIPGLSVAIITLNEEKNIGRCLDSVRDVADEILIIDSYSTDRTKDICLVSGAVFLENPFKGHIEQKNVALEKAKFDYVLSLDADEVLSAELRENILKVKNLWSHDSYSFNRLTNYCGKWIYNCGWYPDEKLRLVDRRKASWGGANPHDRIILKEGATSMHLQGDLLHYSYYTITDHLKQIDYFTTIASNLLFQKGKKVGLLKLWTCIPMRFFRDYILKLGILDGYYGFVVSRLNAWATFVKYIKLRSLYQK